MKALALGDEDADVESIGSFLLEIEDAQERVGLGDSEVVAGEDADAAFAPFAIEEISKVFLEELDAALENEGREDVGAARVVKVVEEVREQGVLVTSSADEGRCVGGCQGEWGGVGNAVRARIRWHEVAGPCGNDVSYAASGIDDVVFVARDQMNVKVRHRLSRGFSNVDPDVEAVGKVFGRDGFASDGKGTEYAKFGLLVAREASNHVATCLWVMMRAWPSLTGKASQRANTRSPR